MRRTSTSSGTSGSGGVIGGLLSQLMGATSCTLQCSIGTVQRSTYCTHQYRSEVWVVMSTMTTVPANRCDRAGALTRSLLGYGLLAGPFYLVAGLVEALARPGFQLTR